MKTGVRDRRGVTHAQYAILLALLAIALLLSVTVYGNDVKTLFFGSSQTIRGEQAQNVPVLPAEHRHHLGDLGQEDAGSAASGGGGAAGGSGISAQQDAQAEQGAAAGPAGAQPPGGARASGAGAPPAGTPGSPISQPVGPTALDRTILAGLQPVLGPATPNESKISHNFRSGRYRLAGAAGPRSGRRMRGVDFARRSGQSCTAVCGVAAPGPSPGGQTV